MADECLRGTGHMHINVKIHLCSPSCAAIATHAFNLRGQRQSRAKEHTYSRIIRFCVYSLLARLPFCSACLCTCLSFAAGSCSLRASASVIHRVQTIRKQMCAGEGRTFSPLFQIDRAFEHAQCVARARDSRTLLILILSAGRRIYLNI